MDVSGLLKVKMYIMLFFQYLAKLLASLNNWGCSLIYTWPNMNNLLPPAKHPA